MQACVSVAGCSYGRSPQADVRVPAARNLLPALNTVVMKMQERRKEPVRAVVRVISLPGGSNAALARRGVQPRRGTAEKWPVWHTFSTKPAGIAVRQDRRCHTTGRPKNAPGDAFSARNGGPTEGGPSCAWRLAVHIHGPSYQRCGGRSVSRGVGARSTGGGARAGREAGAPASVLTRPLWGLAAALTERHPAKARGGVE